jgi:cell division protein ZapA
MAQVAVTIAGRLYRMACGPGEEAHLEGLAAQFDARISELRVSFGEIGDQRLIVMAAITIADELAEAKRKAAELVTEIATLKAGRMSIETARSVWSEEVAVALDEAAGRIERLAQEMNAAGGKG